VRSRPAPLELADAENGMTAHPLWPVLPLQEQLAPWVMLFIGLALALAFVILVVDSVERL
jgi:hypothetical protein